MAGASEFCAFLPCTVRCCGVRNARRQRPGHVFGNMAARLRHCVAFTRDSLDRRRLFYGEYLVNAQGEDGGPGIPRPQHLTVQGKKAQNSEAPAMEEVMPGSLQSSSTAFGAPGRRTTATCRTIEFTVQRGKLYMLQTRNGKRTAKAALKIAVDIGAATA